MTVMMSSRNDMAFLIPLKPTVFHLVFCSDFFFFMFLINCNSEHFATYGVLENSKYWPN